MAFLIAAVGLTGLYLTPRWPRVGWILSLCTQPLWVCLYVSNEDYVLIILAFAYGFGQVRMLRSLKKKQQQPAAGVPASGDLVVAR